MTRPGWTVWYDDYIGIGSTIAAWIPSLLGLWRWWWHWMLRHGRWRHGPHVRWAAEIMWCHGVVWSHVGRGPVTLHATIARSIEVDNLATVRPTSCTSAAMSSLLSLEDDIEHFGLRSYHLESESRSGHFLVRHEIANDPFTTLVSLLSGLLLYETVDLMLLIWRQGLVAFGDTPAALESSHLVLELAIGQ